MKNRLFPVVWIIIISALLIIGCEKRTTSPSETDWDAVKSLIAHNPDIFALDLFGTEADTLFYREITSRNGDIEEGNKYPADSTHWFEYISLTWGDSLIGTFHYRSGGNMYIKPISAIALTNAYFEKWGDNADPYLGWLLKQVSGTVINSVGTTRHLYSVNIVSEGVDVFLSEPYLLRLVKKDSTLVFQPGKQVTFTIDVPEADTSDFFYLRIKEDSTSGTIPFTNNGDETLSASWTTTTDASAASGYKHAIIDDINRKSVTDTTYKYDSKAWGIIYRIK